MEEKLISFETAKLAKEKGFDGDSDIYYFDGIDNIGIIGTLPTQSLLQKWLREVHDIKLCISWTETDNWLYEINHKQEGISGYNTYEQALEIGLQEALKLIKNE